jgi:hypothetical protein
MHNRKQASALLSLLHLAEPVDRVAMSFSSGMTPASDSRLDLTTIMNRIGVCLLVLLDRRLDEATTPARSSLPAP